MGASSDPERFDVVAFNREAWNREVALGNRWTRAVDSATVAAARAGRWSVLLTPTRPVPRSWFPELQGCDVLCLASGGGQQGPVFAACGARVTVLDNAPAQLAQDRLVAEREGLAVHPILGDMADLSMLDDATFNLVFHPTSNNFAPEVRPVWREAFRVLRPGGVLMAGFGNPAVYLFDLADLERGVLNVRHRLPYSDVGSLPPEELALRLEIGEPLEFSHSLEDQIGGQLDAGFLLTHLYEDRCSPDEGDPLEMFMPTFIATRAVKPRQGPPEWR